MPLSSWYVTLTLQWYPTAASRGLCWSCSHSLILHTPYWAFLSQCKTCICLPSQNIHNYHLCNSPQNRQICMLFLVDMSHEFWKAFLSNISTLSTVLLAVISPVSNRQALCCSLANCKPRSKSWLHLLSPSAFKKNSGTIITIQNPEASWGKTPCPQILSLGSAMQRIALCCCHWHSSVTIYKPLKELWAMPGLTDFFPSYLQINATFQFKMVF